MTEHISTRVNSHRLAAYIGRTIRLVGKTLKVSKFLHFSARHLFHRTRQIQGDTAIVEASDGGQVEIRLPKVRAFYCFRLVPSTSLLSFGANCWVV